MARGGRVSDKQETERQVIPAAAPGSLTGDLAGDTDDVATLKQRLGRARERLAFYESFDRIIQENIRRSSELMIEATGLREKAERDAEAQARALATQRDQQDRERAKHAALLGDLQTELDRAGAALAAIAARVSSALEAPGDRAPGEPEGTAAAGEQPPTASETIATSPTDSEHATSEPPAMGTATDHDAASAGAAAPALASPSARPPAAQPAAEAMPTNTAAVAPVAMPEPAVPAEPQLVEVLVHGVPTARVAISLQNHLRGLDRVSTVEAREFVEGLLRLQVTTTTPLAASDLDGWSDGSGRETIRALPDLLEISLPGATER